MKRSILYTTLFLLIVAALSIDVRAAVDALGDPHEIRSVQVRKSDGAVLIVLDDESAVLLSEQAGREVHEHLVAIYAKDGVK